MGRAGALLSHDGPGPRFDPPIGRPALDISPPLSKPCRIVPPRDETYERRCSVQLLKVPEVAELLRLSRSQAYALIRAGEIPAVRIGRHGLRVNAELLTSWLTDHAVGTQGDRA